MKQGKRKARTRSDDKAIGYRVRLERRRLGLTQSDLGAVIGVSFQQIQRKEKGINRISALELWRIAAVLKKDMDYFFIDCSDERSCH